MTCGYAPTCTCSDQHAPPLPTLRRPIGVGMEDFPPDVELHPNNVSEVASTVDFPPEVVEEGAGQDNCDMFPHDVVFDGSSGSGSQARIANDEDVISWVKRIYNAISANHLLHSFKKIRVMIDCCGILAPIVALELLDKLGIEFELVGVSDIEPFVLEFVGTYFNPRHLWSDMLTRDPSELPKNIDLYISGFMCTPWSIRRAGTSAFWHEPAAKTLIASLEVVKAMRPRLVMFENVPGLLRRGTRSKFEALLSELHDYIVALLPPSLCSPTKFGFPIRRDRVYVALVLREEGIESTLWNARLLSWLESFSSHLDSNFMDFVEQARTITAPTSSVSVTCTCSVDTRCLRLHHCACKVHTWSIIVIMMCSLSACSIADHACITCHHPARHPCKCRKCRYQKKKGKRILRPKCLWRRRHRQIMMKEGTYKRLTRDYFKEVPAADEQVRSPRERSMLNMFLAKHPRMLDMLCAFDISQSVDMTAFRSDGLVPCLTTGSRMFVPHLGRCLNIKELYSMMGFPRKRFNFEPYPLTSLQHALGNTMHVAVVGAVTVAMLASLKSMCNTD